MGDYFRDRRDKGRDLWDQFMRLITTPGQKITELFGWDEPPGPEPIPEPEKPRIEDFYGDLAESRTVPGPTDPNYRGMEGRGAEYEIGEPEELPAVQEVAQAEVTLPLVGPIRTRTVRDSFSAEEQILQQWLQEAGYNPGPADGMAGPQTFRALNKALEDAGIDARFEPGDSIPERHLRQIK